MRILVGVAVFLLYGGILLGALPGTPGVSWQGHLFGAVGGVLAAWVHARRTTSPLPALADPRRRPESGPAVAVAQLDARSDSTPSAA